MAAHILLLDQLEVGTHEQPALEGGTHEQPALEGGTHEPTPTKVLKEDNFFFTKKAKKKSKKIKTKNTLKLSVILKEGRGCGHGTHPSFGMTTTQDIRDLFA